jgi:hypothetical protein
MSLTDAEQRFLARQPGFTARDIAPTDAGEAA